VIEGAAWCLVGISFIFSDTTNTINVNAIDISSSFIILCLVCSVFFKCVIRLSYIFHKLRRCVTSRYRLIDGDIFFSVQATPPRPEAFERQIILDAGFKNSRF
jgi:hypothetical protein